MLTIAFLSTRGVLRIFNTTCKTLSALITCTSSSVAVSREEQRSDGTKKGICLAVASRENEKEREFLSRQENGAYIAVDCNAVDRLSPIHPVLPAPREAEERTNYLVILLTENFLRRPAVLRCCSTNAHTRYHRPWRLLRESHRSVCVGVVNTS